MSYLENLPHELVEKIRFTAVFGDEYVDAEFSFQVYGGYAYKLKAGSIEGTFAPAKVFGWQYHGHPLELDDIQILLDKIFEANNLPDDGRNFNANIVLPSLWVRDLWTREEYNNAVEEARHFNWRLEGTFYSYNKK